MKLNIQKLQPAKVKVKKTKAGLGLVADQDLNKGDFVIEYVGKAMTEKEAFARGGMYLFEINKNLTIDGTNRKNTARYINHNCKPNCEVEIKQKRIFISTKKKIAKGEELGYDYGKDFYKEHIKPQGCKCGNEKHLYK
ncbi:MAG: SET domain-containing protein-lysine N-methyltransferase [Candidatus Nomurabacteria bacterium]|nr:SET domain-containing protein-lysine N-methyltransferase [Candidatus Nomurabacteria bacterium]